MKFKVPSDLTVIWFLSLSMFVLQLIVLISRGVGSVLSVNMLRFLARLIRESGFV